MAKPYFIQLFAEKGTRLLVPVADLKWLSEIVADGPDDRQRQHYANGARTRCELPDGEVGYFQEDIQTIHQRIRQECS